MGALHIVDPTETELELELFRKRQRDNLDRINTLRREREEWERRQESEGAVRSLMEKDRAR